ncbi:serine/threonine-protein kinase [Streptomyces sp. DSM 44915]|uniref:Serine/threonine-protein kinase n=1 Tax=Streptomyces chisholmiae TaxID=3075540 RepID=A0ABU2JT48_9ACTN|nr:serine/threonine-protein kinase [Streptomyces sp. DSM 44915]MDT0268171.1 serine/threonine-protein kinase [Streptomyces sp. DSM 44915]
MVAELEPGDPRRVGRYRITGRLGAGGMGRVFLGRSPGGRLVAVKVVRAELADDPGFRARFAREVAAARKVTGLFTAALVDADPDAPTPWLATAYVPGLALDEAVAAHGPWPVASVRALGAGLAEALEAIHAAGLVHRDLKPSNVLVAPDGPRVVDFGISMAVEATALTRAGTVIGTPGFMAPEQLTGAPVTAATDVFALGAVLAYAATGTGPFGTGSAQSLNFRIAYEEPDLAQLPSPGLEIIARCLAKDPAERPTVAAVLDELAPEQAESETHPATRVDPQAGWLPEHLAQALPTASATPRPEPSTAPTSAPPPPPPTRAATTAVPAAPAGPAGAPRATGALWTAIVMVVAAQFLPAYRGDSIADHLGEGSWPGLLLGALNAATCGLLLGLQARSGNAPVPTWARVLHATVTTVVTATLLIMLVGYTGGDLSPVGPGGWSLILAGVPLFYSVHQLSPARALSAGPVPAPAAPGTVTPESRERAASALRFAIAAITVAMFLPAMDGDNVVNHLSEGSWPVAVFAVVNVSTSVLVLSLQNRSGAAPVAAWARDLHGILSTFVIVLLLAMLFGIYEDQGDFDGIGPGVWAYVLGGLALLYSIRQLSPSRARS